VPYFYRTADGSEIDLVLESGGRVEIAVEVKRSTAPEVSKGFRLGCAATRARQRYVVHGGSDEWPMGDNVTAISLQALAQRLKETA
jgi:predicted AAA+ superfamily ATPase